jgi:hypothetical protein
MSKIFGRGDLKGIIVMGFLVKTFVMGVTVKSALSASLLQCRAVRHPTPQEFRPENPGG